MTTTTKPTAPVAAAPARRTGAGALALRQGRLEITQFLRSRESVVFTMGFPIIMILMMLLGRLEVYAIAAMVSWTFWKS